MHMGGTLRWEDVPNMALEQWRRISRLFSFGGSAHPSEKKEAGPIYIDDEGIPAPEERSAPAKKRGRRILTAEEMPHLTLAQWRQVSEQFSFGGSIYSEDKRDTGPIYIDG